MSRTRRTLRLKELAGVQRSRGAIFSSLEDRRVSDQTSAQKFHAPSKAPQLPPEVVSGCECKGQSTGSGWVCAWSRRSELLLMLHGLTAHRRTFIGHDSRVDGQKLNGAVCRMVFLEICRSDGSAGIGTQVTLNATVREFPPCRPNVALQRRNHHRRLPSRNIQRPSRTFFSFLRASTLVRAAKSPTGEGKAAELGGRVSGGRQIGAGKWERSSR